MTSGTTLHRLAIIGGGNMGEALLSGLLDAGWAPPERAGGRRGAGGPARRARRALPGGGAITDAIPPARARCSRSSRTTSPAPRPRRRRRSDPGAVDRRRRDPGDDRGAAGRRGGGRAGDAQHPGDGPRRRGGHRPRHRPATEPTSPGPSGILEPVGTVVRVPEHQLDAVTGLAGSGPAYLMLVAEALIDAGVLVGLPRPTARALDHPTARRRRPTAVRDRRTARGRCGRTSPHRAAPPRPDLRALEDRAVRAAILAAVWHATERSRELGAIRTGSTDSERPSGRRVSGKIPWR